jgi:hypothetical protein
VADAVPDAQDQGPGSGVQLQDLLGVTPWRLARTGSTSPGTSGLKAHELVADKLRRYRVALHSPEGVRLTEASWPAGAARHAEELCHRWKRRHDCRSTLERNPGERENPMPSSATAKASSMA